MQDFLITLKGALPILFAIFIVVFLLIIIARIVLQVVIDRAYHNLLKIKSLKKKVYKKYSKKDDERSRVKIEFPRAHSEMKAEIQARKKSSGQGYEVIDSGEEEQENKELNEVNIVDIVKPVGFWTSMILGQKLTYLISSAQIINKRGDQGFWASMIEAKERAAGKQHSRGR